MSRFAGPANDGGRAGDQLRVNVDAPDTRAAVRTHPRYGFQLRLGF
ncbi:MAG: hypothetical protein H8E66_00480 [Planctomycetes bacterium]|nr:hypothetical protein [Planctomycetota bacterium]